MPPLVDSSSQFRTGTRFLKLFRPRAPVTTAGKGLIDAVGSSMTHTALSAHNVYKGESSDSPFFVGYQRVILLSHTTICRKSPGFA